MKLKVYDAQSKTDIERSTADIEAAISAAERTESDSIEAPPPSIVSNEDLIGIPDHVYLQINAALRSGKKHLMFYGPPGTGKTQLAIDAASQLSSEYTLVTGSSDWTSQDLIGGYMPASDGKIKFVAGLLLQNFDKPFVIDELNRCDIDKVLGALFTVLAGAPSTLPYLTDPDDPNSLRYTILAEYNPRKKDHEFSPTPYWRMLATINSIDKASLYQMSYALMRRFAWILVDVPADLSGFIIEFCKRNSLGAPSDDSTIALADVWETINRERKIGPAPIIDIMRFCRSWKPEFDFFAPPDEDAISVYVAALSSFVLPLLDGITGPQADRILEAVSAALAIQAESRNESELRSRLLEVSV
jgi:MoxR-like ATPase